MRNWDKYFCVSNCVIGCDEECSGYLSIRCPYRYFYWYEGEWNNDSSHNNFGNYKDIIHDYLSYPKRKQLAVKAGLSREEIYEERMQSSACFVAWDDSMEKVFLRDFLELMENGSLQKIIVKESCVIGFPAI